MTEIRDFALPSVGSATIASITSYVEPITEKNPIDTFLASRSNLLRLGTQDLLTSHPAIGQLLLVGSVSAFENYCRALLSGCINLCPISQARSSEKNINFGGAIWHGQAGNFNRSAFEHKSFADDKELKSVFREYIDIDLGRAEYTDLLREYGRIMQLRHAIVHADGYLPGRNAVKLEIPRSRESLRVTVDLVRLQECTLVLSSLAELINREVFFEMCRRWAILWRVRADWQPDNEDRILLSIWNLFVATDYNSSCKNRRIWGRPALKRELISHYSLGE